MLKIKLKKEKNFSLEPIKSQDRNWFCELTRREWGSDKIITRGKIHYAKELNGFIAYIKKAKVGVLTYKIVQNDCEIISLNSLREDRGIGSFLLKKIEKFALLKECTRIWLVTTNDNTKALRFYQKKGFKIRTIYPNIIKDYRILKPELPFTGINGIEIRDEIELEKYL